MYKFLEYLGSIGFKNWEENTKGDFSTMTCVRKLYVKDDLRFIFGLNEKGLPPTLIHPRPNIFVLRLNEDGDINLILSNRDEAMNICLQKESPEDIYNAIFDKEKVFIYDYTKK